MNDTDPPLGHGSRKREGNKEILHFAAGMAERHRPGASKLPSSMPTCCSTTARPRRWRDTRHVLAIPSSLNAAGHVKMELPAAIARAARVTPAFASPAPATSVWAGDFRRAARWPADRPMRQLAMPDPQTTGVVLLGRGLGRRRQRRAARMARCWLFEDGDHELVDLAFTGVTWPRLETVVQTPGLPRHDTGLHRAGVPFTGVLMERIHAQVERLQHQYPQVASLGTHFGLRRGCFNRSTHAAEGAGPT